MSTLLAAIPALTPYTRFSQVFLQQAVKFVGNSLDRFDVLPHGQGMLVDQTWSHGVYNADPQAHTAKHSHVFFCGTPARAYDLIRTTTLFPPEADRKCISSALLHLPTPFIGESEAALLPYFDILLFCCPSAHKAFKSLFPPTSVLSKQSILSLKNSTWMFPGVDTSVFRPNKIEKHEMSKEEIRQYMFQERVAPNQFVILVSGRASDTKQLDQALFVLKSMQKLSPKLNPHLHLHMSEQPYLRELIEGNDLERVVTFSTKLFAENSIPSDEKLRQIYQAADLVLIPSALDYWSDTALEAMACGVPVAGPDEWAIGDLLSGKRGLAFANDLFTNSNLVYTRRFCPATAAQAIIAAHEAGLLTSMAQKAVAFTHDQRIQLQTVARDILGRIGLTL